jgi:serine/threonine protein kinase
MDSRPTLCIDDFQILKTIGTGTFGRVKLARLKGNEKMPPFALKILKKSLVIKYKQVEHVKSEKEVLTKIQHPFITRFFLSFQDEAFIYFLFEYVCGGELFSLLRQVIRFDSETVRFYSSQLLLSVEFLHNKGIVYRDIKPENILIDRKGYLKLTDFGFAKCLDGKTYTMCGTPEYMAPEVIMKGEGYDETADWWSFGVLLYEMAEGGPPFYDENPICIYHKILEGKFSFKVLNDRKLKNLISKLLKDSKKRLGKKHGAEDIKRHGFFAKMSWNDVYYKNIIAPWVPSVESKDDTKYFCGYMDTEESAQTSSYYGSVDINSVFNDF